MKNIVLLGPPGCGKGTQGKYLEKLGYSLVIAGDILRKEKKSGSSLGNKISEIIDKGNLVPDGMISEMIKKHVIDNSLHSFIVFDGYPRTMDQAKYLENVADIEYVMYFNVPDEVLIERLLERGKTSCREDDQDLDIVKNRLKNYKELTLPIKKYYEDQGKLVEIDGNQLIEKVKLDILKYI